ncbi:MAG: electron transport complex subunit RsxG [Aeromonas sp.]
MLASLRKNGLTLAAFAGVCTALVAITAHFTAPRIDAALAREQKNLLSQLLPLTADSEIRCQQLPNSRAQQLKFFRAYTANQLQGYAIETIAPDGYSGAIKLMVGVTPSGRVHAVRVLSHKETPGLGDKLELQKSDWILSFNGKQLTRDNQARWAVKPDGGDFDAFTGATITPRAVVGAVKKVLTALAEQPDQFANAPACAAPNA